MAAKSTKKKTETFKGLEVEMFMARETKGTFRYECEDEESPITTLYIKKSAFEGVAAPDNIVLSIEEG